jgi:putative membrane protein
MIDSTPREAEPASARTTAAQGRPMERTRISVTWVGIVVAAVVLVLLLVFILQNTRSVKVSYLGASGQIPLGVVLLLAAAGGVLLSGVAASLRILQIRRRLGGLVGQSAEPATAPVDDQDPDATAQDPSESTPEPMT